MELKNKIADITKYFGLSENIGNIKPILNGHINKTFFVKVDDSNYIVQEVNSNVFKNPIRIMENIQNITEHIRKKIEAAGEDTERGTLKFLHNRDNTNYYIDNEGKFWRICPYIEKTTSYDQVENLTMLKNAGSGFGKFQSQLSDYPMDSLHETIPNFHNTKKRLDDFFESVKNDKCNRVKDLKKEIEFFEQRYNSASSFISITEDKDSMPLRVTHNDTKYNNILIDTETYEAVCVIDLDTVMPGLSVYDFGDAIRFAASTALEDETNLSKVTINMDYFKAFSEGFISSLNGSLTDIEIKNMGQGCINITIELASRFLADHINGDQYFRIHHPNHNLERARNQIKLASEMELRINEMDEIIKTIKKG